MSLLTRRLLPLLLLPLGLTAIAFAADKEKKVDPTEALRKSCDKGSAEDCRTVALMYARGEEGVTKNLGKAGDYFKKACEGGQAQACFEIASMHRSGEGASKDLLKAIKYY